QYELRYALVELRRALLGARDDRTDLRIVPVARGDRAEDVARLAEVSLRLEDGRDAVAHRRARLAALDDAELLERRVVALLLLVFVRLVEDGAELLHVVAARLLRGRDRRRERRGER